MISILEERRKSYQSIRDLHLGNNIPPSLVFNPVPEDRTYEGKQHPIDRNIPTNIPLPEDRSELAFYTVRELASLVKTCMITSLELTRFFLDRLKTHADTLEAVITLTEERALKQAEKMDRELASGRYRGPLHGIPYGLKDLFAMENTRQSGVQLPIKTKLLIKRPQSLRNSTRQEPSSLQKQRWAPSLTEMYGTGQNSQSLES